MDIMYRIHTALCSLRGHLTWQRGSANQQNEQTSVMPLESLNVNCPNTEEEEKIQEAFDVGDGDDHIINTFDTEQPPHSAPPKLRARDRIQKGFFKLLSPSDTLQQDVEKLQMSIMYPPGTMPLNPIVEVDEQGPESPSVGKVFKFENIKPFFKSALKAIINATQFKLLWEHSSDNVKSYANGFYWVCYSTHASGHKITVLDEYDPYTKNESIRTNLVIALCMIIIAIVINILAKGSEKYLKFFESAGGMFTFFIVFGAMLGMHFAMFLIPRTRKIPVNFICILIIALLASIITSFITAKFKTYILVCVLVVVCISGSVHVFLATARFDFRRFYLMFVTVITATSGTIVVSTLMFILRLFNAPLQVMWTLVLGNAMSLCLAMELTLIAQMKTLLLTDEDYCLGGYILFMSSVDIFVRIVQVLIRFDRY